VKCKKAEEIECGVRFSKKIKTYSHKIHLWVIGMDMFIQEISLKHHMISY